MSNTDFGPITALGDVLNTGGNLLGSAWGIASFSTPDQVNGNFVFYVAGQDGISVHHLLHCGTIAARFWRLPKAWSKRPKAYCPA